ncbi:MAG: hypothetical protein Q8S00_31365 [Deltaproteobacteria bacterium]|nr:hypothetical protein [Deltaproteobacteria bacterium]MDZ4347622.1 hypothetical protein [Candidatus Binatia bacterium]
MNLRIGTVFLVSLILTWALPARAQEIVTLATRRGFRTSIL